MPICLGPYLVIVFVDYGEGFRPERDLTLSVSRWCDVLW